MAGGQKENVSLLTHSLLEANANFLPLRETRKLLGGNFQAILPGKVEIKLNLLTLCFIQLSLLPSLLPSPLLWLRRW